MADDKFYEKDGKVFERGGGLFGTDKEVGSIEKDVWGNEVKVKTPGTFTDNLHCKRTDDGKFEVFEKTLNDSSLFDFREGREGFTIEKDWQSPHGQTSHTLHEAPWENDKSEPPSGGGYSGGSSHVFSNGGEYIIAIICILLGVWCVGLILDYAGKSSHKTIQPRQTQPQPTKTRSNPEPVSKVGILHAGVAEYIDEDGIPLGEGSVFYGNARYYPTHRDRVFYFANYSGAVPGRTRFSAKMYFNGKETLYTQHCPSTTAEKQDGLYICKTGPYILAPGDWEVRLFADTREVNRTQFTIIPAGHTEQGMERELEEGEPSEWTPPDSSFNEP